jgi:uncharacterized protein
MNIRSNENRLSILDLLRGFALLGILIVNLPFLSHGLVPVAPIFERTLGDQAVVWLGRFAFEAKFYLLFSFLFGYGLSVQLARADTTKTALGPRYARRLLGLALLGVVHATCFFVGDILVSYALLGSILWGLRHKTPQQLIRIAIAMLILAVLCRFVLLALIASHPSAAPITLDPGYRGDFLDGMRQRLQDLIVFYVFTPLFNWPSALGLFALGLAAGKKKIFEDLAALERSLMRVFFGLLILGVGGNALYASFPDTLWTLPLDAVAAPALSALYVLLVLKARHRLGWLASAGQMSLSNYLGQALIASLVFCGWGFGQFGHWGALQVLLFALVVWIHQVWISHYWLIFFRYGPDEWLLRCLTYGRWEPLRKSPVLE